MKSNINFCGNIEYFQIHAVYHKVDTFGQSSSGLDATTRSSRHKAENNVASVGYISGSRTTTSNANVPVPFNHAIVARVDI